MTVLFQPPSGKKRPVSAKVLKNVTFFFVFLGFFFTKFWLEANGREGEPFIIIIVIVIVIDFFGRRDNDENDDISTGSSWNDYSNYNIYEFKGVEHQ